MMEPSNENCLTCFYEPEWGEWGDGKNGYQSGKCRFAVKLPPLPSIYKIRTINVVRYKDNSGIESNCPTWENKK